MAKTNNETAVYVRLSKEIRKALRIVAGRDDRTIAATIRIAIEQYLKRRGVQ